MNTIKRIIAIAALFFAAVFILMIVYFLLTGQMANNGNLIMLPLSAFLGLALIALAINWLQKLKAEKLKEAMQNKETK